MKKDETYSIKSTRFFLEDLYGPDDYDKDFYWMDVSSTSTKPEKSLKGSIQFL